MKKNATKERLFEVTARLDKTFKPVLNEEVLPAEDKRIATTYQTVTPESAEQSDFADHGWENEEGESMLPDQYDTEEGITAVDKAVKFLQDNGGTEPSSSQFNTGVWYGTPDPDHNNDYFTKGEEKYYSFHLKGFTPEEEAEIFNKIKGGENLPQQQNVQEIAPIAATSTATQQYGQQPDVTYADSTYKQIAPALKQINTPEKFAGAFKGWFQYLGYTPQGANITVQRIKMDVESALKQLGYR